MEDEIQNKFVIFFMLRCFSALEMFGFDFSPKAPPPYGYKQEPPPPYTPKEDIKFSAAPQSTVKE
jgi:hypothetical protein